LTLRFSPQDIEAAAKLLREGETLAFPTETVYGLGADALNNEAVLKIYAAKGRPRFNPLIAHVSCLEEALEWGVFNETALILAKLWPAPLTLVVPMRKPISDIASSGLNTIGLRVPAHPLALDLLKAVGRPVVAPSANRSGHVSPTSPQHVLADLEGRISGILEGGNCQVGLESTIIACFEKPHVLREGGLACEIIETHVGKLERGKQDIIAPGMMLSHYAPTQKLRLNALNVVQNESLLAFGEPLKGSKYTLNLSPIGSLEEAAKNLFAHLRTLDSYGLPIAVMPLPRTHLGAALNDRLKRAAHG
jgi:L-threonylcarbamoyladenylate synthase